MIDAHEVWPHFLEEARIYEENQEIFCTPSEAGKYKIYRTTNDVIRIERVNVPGSTETISIIKFVTAIGRINAQPPIFLKGRVYEHVAEEVTIVELLPFLDWSEDGRAIVNSHNIINFDLNSEELLNEAVNDDPNKRTFVSVRQRKGQRKFREKLLQLYDNECAISRCGVKEVLHACHINPHNVSGINLSTNGLILRSDLHDLFDQNLVAVEPNTNMIKISSKLRNTQYFEFNNHILKDRNDNKQIDPEALKKRWRSFVQ